MIDIPSLLLVAGLLFGLIAGDAALFGDTLRVDIAVPQALNNAGFTEAAAEAVFTAEAAQVVQGESIISAPPLRVQSTTSVIAALARPLNLDSVVTAMQTQFGIDHLVVAAAILAEAAGKTPVTDAVRPLTPGTRLDMVVVVIQPHQAPVQTVLEQPDGDVTTLVKRAADWSMEQVSPYRVVLAQFLAGIGGDQASLAHAKVVANRFLEQPWVPERASEQAMTHNVLALLALLDNNVPEAEAQLALTATIPGVLPQVRAELALNHSFIAVTEKHPKQGAELLADSRQYAAKLDLPGFAEHLAVQQALIAWSSGDVAGAEAKLRGVVAAAPNSETAHHYLAMLLRAKGDAAGAAAAEKAAQFSRRFEDKLQGLAVLLFWTDPVNGGVTRRL